MFKWLWTIFSLGAPERVHHKHNIPLFGLIENNAYWLKYSVFSPQLPCGFCATSPRSAFPTTLVTGYTFFSQLFWLFFPTPTPADYSLYTPHRSVATVYLINCYRSIYHDHSGNSNHIPRQDSHVSSTLSHLNGHRFSNTTWSASNLKK